MTTQIFHNRLGQLLLHRLQVDDHPKTALCPKACYESNAFLGKLSVQEFDTNDGSLLLHDYTFQPAVELTKRDNYEGLKLVVMLSGNISLQPATTEKWLLSEGKLCIFRSTDYHISLPGQCHVKYLVFYMDDVLERMGWTGFKEGVYSLTVSMRQLLTEIMNPPQSVTLPREWLSLQLANLLLQLLMSVGSQQEANPGKRSLRHLALAGDAYILRNLDKNFTYTDIVRDLGTNENTLKEAFKHHFSAGISKRQNQHRVKLAMEKMLESDKSLKEISRECGYDSELTFRKNFFKETNENPSEWRQKNKL